MAMLASRCNSRLLLTRLLSHPVVSQIGDRRNAVRSRKFPEYSVLFEFDKVVTASRINRMKLQATIFYTISLPTLYVSQVFLGLITPSLLNSFTTYGAAITIFFHSIGYLFNNVVGYVYLKDDNESVKISYVGYWGERIDLDTKIDEIWALSDTMSRFSNPWYQKVRLTDSKKTLKMYVTAGRVVDYKIFNAVFGKISVDKP